jgi:hypothetical protein
MRALDQFCLSNFHDFPKIFLLVELAFKNYSLLYASVDDMEISGDFDARKPWLMLSPSLMKEYSLEKIRIALALPNPLSCVLVNPELKSLQSQLKL